MMLFKILLLLKSYGYFYIDGNTQSSTNIIYLIVSESFGTKGGIVEIEISETKLISFELDEKREGGARLSMENINLKGCLKVIEKELAEVGVYPLLKFT